MCRCDLTSEQVITRYTAGGHSEAAESASLLCWTEEELFSSVSKPEVAVKVAHAMTGIIQLYNLYKT